MTKTYFQFLEQAESDSDIEQKYKRAKKQAEEGSRSGDHEQYVYQNRMKTCKVKASDDPLDEPWMLCGTAVNGVYKETTKPCDTCDEAYAPELQAIDEILSFAGRRGLKRAAKRRKARLAITRKQAKKRTAPMNKILNRAQRRARRHIAAHLMGGKSKKNLSHTGLNRIQQMVNARKGQLDQLRRKLIPSVRKADRRK